jgi:hypothetical protein
MHANHLSKVSNMQFSEPEAARMLGLSIDQLRSLVRDHIVKDEEAETPAMTTYQQTDLVLLRILSRMPRAAHATVRA